MWTIRTRLGLSDLSLWICSVCVPGVTVLLVRVTSSLARPLDRGSICGRLTRARKQHSERFCVRLDSANGVVFMPRREWSQFNWVCICTSQQVWSAGCCSASGLALVLSCVAALVQPDLLFFWKVSTL